MTDIFKGATSNSVFVELVDSTTGLPKTGIVYTDVTGSYVRTRSARVAITMATLASASASFSSGGFILIDDTNQPGVCRVDVPDAAFATGAQSVVVTIKATGCRTVSRLFNLVDVNNQVAYAPNVAAGGVGGLLTAPTTANTGLANVTQIGGDTQSLEDLKDFADAGYDPTANTVTAVLDSSSVTAVQSGLALEATSQSIKTKTDNLPTDPADQSLIIAATDAVMARLGAPAGASVSADVAAVKSDTASLLSRLTANAATAIQNLFHMITGTGASSKYTVAALENAPASGGGGDAEQDTLLEVQTTVNALALSLAGTSVTVTSRVSGSEITAYIGDDYKVRSGTELEITVSDTGGALHTKLAAIGTSNLYFGASLPRKDPGQITGTISSLSYASNVLTIAVEITACASGLTTGDYTYQIQSSQAQGGDFDDFVELEGTLVVKQRTVAVRG